MPEGVIPYSSLGRKGKGSPRTQCHPSLAQHPPSQPCLPLPSSPASAVIPYNTARPVPPLLRIRMSRLSFVLTKEGHCSSNCWGEATTSISARTCKTLVPTKMVAVTLYCPGKAYTWTAAFPVVLRTSVWSPNSHSKVLTAMGILTLKSTAWCRLYRGWSPVKDTGSCAWKGEGTSDGPSQSCPDKCSVQNGKQPDEEFVSRAVPHKHCPWVLKPPYSWSSA